jgi:hypothetical protein
LTEYADEQSDAKRNKGNALYLKHGIKLEDFDGISGEEALAKIPSTLRPTIQAIIEGRKPMSDIPSREGMRTDITTLVDQIDPTYNAARHQVYKLYTSGDGAKQLNSANMVIGHAGTFYGLAKALENKDLQAQNRLTNWVKQQTGYGDVTSADTAASAVGTELAKFLRGTGAINKEEQEDWVRKFDAKRNSPEQLLGNVHTAIKLLESRTHTFEQQFKTVGLKNGLIPVLNDEAKTVLARIDSDKKAEEAKKWVARAQKANPGAPVATIIAEGVPEKDTKQLIAYARMHNKVIIGPATVGGVQVRRAWLGGLPPSAALQAARAQAPQHTPAKHAHAVAAWPQAH